MLLYPKCCKEIRIVRRSESVSSVCIIGHFGFGKVLLNGQTIKTKIIAEEVENKFRKENVILLDLAGGVKQIPYLLVKIPLVLSQCDNLIIMPVENGLRFLVPILNMWNVLLRKKLHYIVIGGWLPKFISNRKWLQKGLRKFNGVYVETQSMKTALEGMQLGNLVILPNCKNLSVLSEDELVYPSGMPLRLCTFSRVMKEKGIETAANAIQNVNAQLGYVAFSLDVYGPIWADSQNWFAEVQKGFPQYICYRGVVEAEKSVEVLQNYFAMLFPTHFLTEGLPGTIIDAYAAGLPVIASKWDSFSDIIEEGRTGMGYEFNCSKSLESLLLQVARNPKVIIDMKRNCIIKAKEYAPQKATEKMLEKLEGV